jgi:hypothetical protein
MHLDPFKDLGHSTRGGMMHMDKDGKFVPMPDAWDAKFIRGLRAGPPPHGLPFWLPPVTTDAEGRFLLRGLGCNLGVGLEVSDDRLAFRVEDVPPQDKERHDEVRLVLPPSRLLEGTVTDATTGRPVAGARVHVETFEGALMIPEQRFIRADWKGRRLAGSLTGDTFLPTTPVVEARTDERGQFRLNPYFGGKFRVTVTVPEGEPYLGMVRTVEQWPRGAARQVVNFALPRAIVVRGRVTEAGSGRVVAGARVDYWSLAAKLPPEALTPRPVKTGPDGVFRIAVPAGKGHVLVNGPADLYERSKIATAKLHEGPPDREVLQKVNAGEPPYFAPDAWLALDLPATARAQEVQVAVRRKQRD